MIYGENLKKVTTLGTYIGSGNPNSQILIVGKEVATDIEEGIHKELEQINLETFNNNCTSWIQNIKSLVMPTDIPNWSFDSKENNPIHAFKGVEIKKEGHTWRKYQKLNNFIFEKETQNVINFQDDFFITEMSILPSKTTAKAQKKADFLEKLSLRKETFFRSEFIQDFSVVILACGNYISGPEICNIFNVHFTEEKGTARQKFWIHSNAHKTKLVVHTRQLSADVSDELLRGIAEEVKTFLREQFSN